MENKVVKKKFLVLFALLFAISLGIALTSIRSVGAEGIPTGKFQMVEGASVRVEEPYGIRFTTEVGDDYLASLESLYKNKTVKFGTLISVERNNVNKVVDVEAKKTVEVSGGIAYHTVITDIPEKDFYTNINAKSYAKVYDGSSVIATFYAENNGQVRSIAQVASMAVANGESTADYPVLATYLKDVSGITANGEEINIPIGEAVSLTEYFITQPKGLTPKLTSSDPEIVEIVGEKVKAIAMGKAVITAEICGYKATINVTVSNQSVIYSGSGKLDYVGWPSVARIYNGDLLAVWSKRQLHQDPYGKVVGAISKDNGLSWSEPFTIIDSVLDDRDAGVLFWNNKVFVTSFTASKSTYIHSGTPVWDAEWTAYSEAISDADEAKYIGNTYAIGELNQSGELVFGEVMRHPLTSPHGMFKLNNGDIGYIGAYYNENTKKLEDIRFYTSSDGLVWNYVSTICDVEETKDAMNQYNEPYGIQLPSGKILFFTRSEVSGIWQCESTDGGVTWTDKHLVANAKITPPHVMQMADGTLVLTYGYRDIPYGIRAKVSKDGGETWSKELTVTINNDYELSTAWDFGYPCTIEIEEGKLLTVFYQRLHANDEKTSLLQVIWTIPEPEPMVFESNRIVKATEKQLADYKCNDVNAVVYSKEAGKPATPSPADSENNLKITKVDSTTVSFDFLFMEMSVGSPHLQMMAFNGDPGVSIREVTDMETGEKLAVSKSGNSSTISTGVTVGKWYHVVVDISANKDAYIIFWQSSSEKVMLANLKDGEGDSEIVIETVVRENDNCKDWNFKKKQD